jgi:hypothetical protein
MLNDIFFDRTLIYTGGQVSTFRTCSKDAIEALDSEIKFVMNNSGYAKDKEIVCISITQG